MDERQTDIVKQGLYRMFNLCENRLLMLNLGKLISMHDLDHEFNKITDSSIKMLSVILNSMKTTIEKLRSELDFETLSV